MSVGVRLTRKFGAGNKGKFVLGAENHWLEPFSHILQDWSFGEFFDFAAFCIKHSLPRKQPNWRTLCFKDWLQSILVSRNAQNDHGIAS